MLRHLFVCSVIILLSLSIAVAQQVDYGNINGIVKDETDAVLPGVTVTISSPAMILPQKVTTTNERGFYRFPALTVGEYTVSFELSGFATVVREGIIVSVGKTTTLNVTMRIAAVAETITVTGESPVVDKEKTTLGVNFSKVPPILTAL